VSLQLPSGADRTPLAHLAPLAWMPPPRAKKKVTALTEADHALVAALAAEMTSARAECESAWRDALDRPPVREELASALGTVLAASADDFTSDPARAEQAERPRRVVAPQRSAAASITIEIHEGVERAVVAGHGPTWVAYPFREDGSLIVETSSAGDAAPTLLPAVLSAWRAHHGLPEVAEPVTWRPMDWGAPVQLRA
jgi:hypothetical protein